MSHQTLKFSLKIPQTEILRYYKGNARHLIVTLDNGQRVQLPLENFRPYISDLGLYGSFEVLFTEEFKLIKLNKLSG